ncbi:MAG: VOC family protein [Planctomycetota bacterium]|nr:VOC family protein [Planctomycetota bacterium]
MPTQLELAKSPLVVDPSTKFHLSINVSDLDRSVEFYRLLFGCEPAKCRVDYAKFELQDPPLVFSLEPHAPSGSGQLNHAGFRLPDYESLLRTKQRLANAGIDAQEEKGVECCYSRQTKFWAHDPDGCLWEIYILEEDLDHRGDGQSTTAVLGKAVTDGPNRVAPLHAPKSQSAWEHRLGQPCVVPAEFAPGSLDEVRLTGSFNLPVESAVRDVFLKSVWHALRPGGRVTLHLLTADREIAAPFGPLPGPAAVVKAAPSITELLSALSAAGFVAMRLTKYDSTPCFPLDVAELRQTRIEAYRSADENELAHPTVVYRGPYSQVVTDDGAIFLRGIQTPMSSANWQTLVTSGADAEFTLIPLPNGELKSCGGK